MNVGLLIASALALGDEGAEMVSAFIAQSRREGKRALILDVGANQGTWGESVLRRTHDALRHVQLVSVEPQA